MTEGRYGVRWQEVTRTGHVKTREKFFATDKELNRFMDKVSEKDNFVEFQATMRDRGVVAPARRNG